MPGRWTVTPGGDECALWSPETTVKVHCGLDKSFNMHTLLPADQMHSGSAGGPGGATQWPYVSSPLRKQEEREHMGCEIRIISFSAGCSSQRKRPCALDHWERSRIPSWRKRRAFTPVLEHTILHVAWKSGPRLLALVLHTEKSVCFMVSAWGATTELLERKEASPTSKLDTGNGLLLRERVRGPVPCRFPIWNLCVNY